MVMARLSIALVLALGLAQTTLPLVQKADLTYDGAFRYPQGFATDAESYNYGGAALTYDAAHDTLFAVGFDPAQLTGEFSIPAIRNVSVVTDLAVATTRQPLTDILHGKRLTVDGDLGNGVKIGGIFPLGSDLIVSAFTYYDGGGTQTLSHFRVNRDFTQAAVTGPVAVSNSLGRAGFVFSYMVPIPAAWQAAFGGPAFTGGCCKAIIGRTSLGPSLTVFNPANVGSANPVPGTTVLGYPITHPTLGIYEGGPLYNGTAGVGGAVWPEGTRSILFFGRNTTGQYPYCYGVGQDDPALHLKPVPGATNLDYCYDKADHDKGPHMYPYTSFVWAYDANDLLLVKNGTKQPWEVVPYATWGFTTPFMTEGYNVGNHAVLGATYKPSTRQIFISEELQDGSGPVVHVFRVNVGTAPTPTPTPTPVPTPTPTPTPTPVPTPTPTPTTCALTMAPTTLPGGTVGVAYFADVSVHNGTGPYTLGVSSGSTLPAGLSIGLLTGLTGTPTTAGTYTFSLHTSDAMSCDLDQAYSVTIASTAVPPPPPPPTNVCVTDPLTLRVSSWPSSQSGSRLLSYTTNKVITSLTLTWPLSVTVKDGRGCSATLTKQSGRQH